MRKQLAAWPTRVATGISLTMARCTPVSTLSRLLFPTLGLPTMATLIPNVFQTLCCARATASDYGRCLSGSVAHDGTLRTDDETDVIVPMEPNADRKFMMERQVGLETLVTQIYCGNWLSQGMPHSIDDARH